MSELPAVGTKIKRDYGAGNPNTWKHWGEVRAVVDDHLIVRRWQPHRRVHGLEIVTPEDWSYGKAWRVKP